MRPGTPEDLPFVRAMLYEAVHWPEQAGPKPPSEELLSEPVLARYLDGWGREGDLAVIATSDTGTEGDGSPVGAAWCRLFAEHEPGYGFVDDRTPEIAMAVSAGDRGRGVGGALLAALMDAARASGSDALSLSVQKGNPTAARLYRRVGFVEVRDDGEALTMRVDLNRGSPTTHHRSTLRLTVGRESLAICRLAPERDLPLWAAGSSSALLSVTRTREELSVVCPEEWVPRDVRAERGWLALKLEGPFELSLTGILASVLDPLAQAGIPIFALSTYDTDYVLVRREQVERVAEVLARNGHEVLRSADAESTSSK